ncbi:MAG: efflux RND transporter periplasmic adaptor subunit [Peptococcaceae bacterium]|nr:efflux RND transporter periplasmic adaptor subunit [Peptococcaceae bacterium]
MAEAASKKKLIMRAVLGVIVVILIAAGLVYYIDAMRYVTSDDAQISTADGDSVPITVALPGRLSNWKVNVNDYVNQGQIIGTESNQSVLNLNPTILPYIQQNPLLEEKLVEMENIRSPISGRVQQANAASGEGVQPGQVLAVIANTAQPQVTANIQEAEISRVRVGQSVDVTVDGLPGQTLHGTVTRVEDYTQSVFALVPNITAASGSFTRVAQRVPVEIALNEQNLAKDVLVPGMSVTVKIHVE